MSRYLRSAAALLVLHACGSLAHAQGQALRQMDHALWTARDGAPQAINALVQDRDGTLWIGSEVGLANFDGHAFRPFQSAPGQPELPLAPVQSLLIASDGSLWAGFYQSGIARIKSGKVTLYTHADKQLLGLITFFSEADDGSVWAVANQRYVLRLGDDEQWHVDTSPQESRIGGLFIDRANTLWLAQGGVLYKRPLPQSAYVSTAVQSEVVFGFAQTAEGDIWIADVEIAVDRGRLQRIDSTGQLVGRLPFTAVPSGLAVGSDGALIVSLQYDGVRRFAARELSASPAGPHSDPDTLTNSHGLSANATTTTLVDAHGNIWVGSKRGIDRLRPARLTSFLPEANEGSWHICSTRQGELWVANSSGRLHYISGTTRATYPKPGDIYSIACAENGHAWVVDHRGVRAVKDGRMTLIPALPGAPPYSIGPITVTADHTLYAATGSSMGSGQGMWRYKDRQWTKLPGTGTRGAGGFSLHVDRQNRLWKGYANGLVFRHDPEEVRRYESGRPGLGYVFALFDSPRGMFAAGNGLAIHRESRFDKLTFADPDFARGVRGIAESRNGDLWLNTAGGIVRIPADELSAALATASHPIRAEMINEGEFAGAGQSLSSSDQTIAIDANGHLWFATRNGLVSLDPEQKAVPNRPPIVTIRSLVTDGVVIGDSGVVAPAPRIFEASYVGVNLTAPEKVVYRYRLEGFDNTWEEAGGRTEAIYTRLPPGTYTFSVIASNGDGVWTAPVSSQSFTVPPSFYQTRTFAAAMVVLGMLIVAGGYRLRVRQISRVMAARFEERLAERTRVARELHDTLLQTVHGSKMVADRALRDAPEPARLVGALEQLSQWLGQAAEEGRAALQSLRTTPADSNDLASAFRRVIDECYLDAAIDMPFTVEGPPRALQPAVRDDVYRIGYEAFRNACVHSRATRIALLIEYGRDLTIRVSDNGVGIDAATIEHGKDGHFGLRGMRERAERIGATLTMVSSASAGTTVTLTVPGQIAFQSV